MAGKPGAVKTPGRTGNWTRSKRRGPKGGLAAAQAALPQRSKNSIKGESRGAAVAGCRSDAASPAGILRMD